MATKSKKPDVERFLAPPPVVVPRGASRQQQLELAYPAVPPPGGSRERAEYDVLVKGETNAGMAALIKTTRKRRP